MKVLAIGGATIDTIVSMADSNIERMTLRNEDSAYLLLEVGRKTKAEDVSVHCGGGAINAAIAMCRLGNETSVLVKLGRDFHADVILSRLAAEGIATRYTARDEHAPTGTSVFLSAHDRNTAVIAIRGANSLITSADLDDSAFAVDLVYVAGLSDDSADSFPEIVAQANAAGALVAANPGIRPLSSRQGAFRATLANIDLLAINRHEENALLPWLASDCKCGSAAPYAREPDAELPDLARHGFSVDGTTMNLSQFFESLFALGPRWIVVTDGKDGAYIGHVSGITHCPALPVEIIGTAGAGDAFNAAFSAFITAGALVEEAVTAAAINSASVVTHLDTQTGLLTGEALAVQVAEQQNALRIRHWPFR